MKQFASIPLSLLILFSSLNLNFVSHYCGGRLIQTKFITGTGSASCGMEGMDSACDGMASGTALGKQDCCEDDWLQVTIKDNYKQQDARDGFINTGTFFPPSSRAFSLPENMEVHSGFLCKKPPDIGAVTLSFLQVFIV